jgi:threonylcarbamoyladenosine tRNA methylthiotransferase MtaB
MNKFPKIAAFYTIGCRLNQAESALLCGRLEAQGCRIVEFNVAEKIDLIIVNTCTVTGNAARKSRQIARKLKKEHPDACLVITGCSAEIENSFWVDEAWVDLVLPNPEKKNIVKHLQRLMTNEVPADFAFSPQQDVEQLFYEAASASFPFKSRAFLKIQEGCNNFCTYCIVPYARGRERSRSRSEVIADFRRLLANGFCEIVLVGVNVSTYNDHGCKLCDLLAELCREPGNYRIRLSSTEPHLGNMQLIDVMAANPNICRFLHLSLKHGSDTILKSMNRKYSVAQFAEFMAVAKQQIPGIHIGTDVIVGFPGETAELFAESAEFIRRMEFANIHIFTYSPREGTPAASYPHQVPAPIAKIRYNSLTEIAEASKLKFIESQLKYQQQVIFERCNKTALYEGWSDNYVGCLVDDQHIQTNIITNVMPYKITTGDRLLCKVVD